MTALIFGVDGLIVALLILLPLAFVIYGAVDAVLLPTQAWRTSSESKVMWIALPFVGLVLCVVAGPILTAIYLAVVRPRVRAAVRRPLSATSLDCRAAQDRPHFSRVSLML